MHSSIARRATASIQNTLRQTKTALLPPIPLYRRLLRAHRKHLPAEMRVLGDEYIKAEFRLHRKVDNPAHLHHSSQSGAGGLQLWFVGG
ncbi:hypothetical protein X797_005741 [Metarhizium robertsii]|uniref:Succinate dehydrogenase assembly factor 3 n=1 Tax=Metarhizium robertsii TaxID=568076 RepID=A0A014R0M9_9HYPO|nr:hypothetical protein X797_005741 [Metarhizium robertsii]